MLIAGIDEAGRGPCFGPMTMSIVVLEKKQELELKALGVKDSKDIPAPKRDSLFSEVQEAAVEHYTIVVRAVEINDLMVKDNLNEIEAMKVAEAINKLTTDVAIIYIDSPDTTKGKYEGRIRKYLDADKQKIEIVSENKADSKYVVVGAASILAKVTRDREIEKLKEKHGEIGSGYPADPKTKKFLADYVKETNLLPPFSRIFWSTCKRALEVNDPKQKKLF